ncbi:hypothetical protein [Pseudomonas nitroreducens]|uniref:hypothetical protein n=1 Tax=Pseudomonas nitroreducens TaxID=46680 RepID=UPI003CC827E9
MANLGNIGQWAKVVPQQYTQFSAWAAWPDVGQRAVPAPPRQAQGWFSYTRAGSGNVITIPTSGIVTLTRRGQFVDIRSGQGAVNFYDLDAGTYQATQPDTGAVWQVEIMNNVVTVTPLGGGSTPVTHAAAFVMA